MFIADFIRDPLWDRARWEATTFGWDKKGVGPPYMGIVFGDAEAARALFGKWVARHANADKWDAIRIAIIENSSEGTNHASAPGARSGSVHSYTVHICCDPVSLASDGEATSALLQNPQMRLPSRLCRAEPLPLPETPGAAAPLSLLGKFKEEYAKHKEFLFAPVTRRADAQLRVDVSLGIIKRQIHLRHTSDLDFNNPLDLDALALRSASAQGSPGP